MLETPKSAVTMRCFLFLSHTSCTDAAVQAEDPAGGWSSAPEEAEDPAPPCAPPPLPAVQGGKL